MAVCSYCKKSPSAPPSRAPGSGKPGAMVWHCIAYTCPVCSRMMAAKVFPVSAEEETGNPRRKPGTKEKRVKEKPPLPRVRKSRSP